MSQVRVIVEYAETGATAPSMRWERTAPAAHLRKASRLPGSAATHGTFELLGRAFEVAQREEGAGFSESLAAFLKGALIGKQDILNVMSSLDDHAE